MLESKIYPNPEVQQFLSTSYVGVLLQSDSPDGQQMMRQFGMRGIPALFVMDQQGRVRGKMSGAPNNASSFMQTVDALASGRSF